MIFTQISRAHHRALTAQQKHNDSERRDEYLFGALQYLDCEETHLYEKAAKCLQNAKEIPMAAKVYKHIGKVRMSDIVFTISARQKCPSD